MTLMKKHLVGKSVKSLSFDVDNWAIEFDEKTWLVIYTNVLAQLNSVELDPVVEDIVEEGQAITIFISGKSTIKISLDPELLDGPEFFVLSNSDGVLIVET